HGFGVLACSLSYPPRLQDDAKFYWPVSRNHCPIFHECPGNTQGTSHMDTVASAKTINLRALAARWVPVGLSVFASAVFLDSLRFKFTEHVNTQEIFGALDRWAAGLGAPGLFAHTGLFSQYVIGSAELAASTLLLIGLTMRFRPLSVLGA